jgi:hypothetical protein
VFVNLHTLPAGQHMYTAWVTYDPYGEVKDADEIDFIADARASVVILQGECASTRDYKVLYPDARIIGIVDQSTGEKLWAEEGIKR